MALFSGRRRAGQGGFFASRQAMSVAALVCIGVMLVSVNIIAARYLNLRWDLTANRLYTLSRGTKATLAKIDEPITLRFYYSTRLGETIPSYGVYAQRVRELLDQYVTAAQGKIRLEVYNPLAFSDAEDRAVALGLQAAPLNTEGDQVYFGLSGNNSTDDQQVIPFFAPERERFLEYDLTKLVHSLAFPKKTVIGLMTGLPLEGDITAAMQGRPMRPMAVIDQLNQLDRVDTLSPTVEAIPPGVDVLMLVHPQKLSDQTLFAIDQFVLRGGKALVFVDPYSELQAGSQPPRTNSGGEPAFNSDLDRLLQRWGLRLLPNVVVGDRRAARRVAAPVAGRGNQAMDYIAWLNLRADYLNRDDVITADLNQVAMASAGVLEPVPGAETKIEPLVTTSAESTKIPVEKVQGLPDVAGLLAQFRPDDKRYILAARVSGTAQTAFPDGPPKKPEKPEQKGEAEDKSEGPPPEAPKPPAEAKPVDIVKQSVQPINVIVVADSDMLDDRFWAQSQDYFGQRVIVPMANNGDFVANAVDVLAGGQDLVDLRSRGTSVRPFELVENIQRAADDRYAAEQQSLERKLKETQGKLRELTGSSGDQNNASAPLSADQSKTIEEFRGDLLKTRQQLRSVRAALREDIEDLKAVFEFFDIALIPIIVAAVALVVGALRLKRRRRRPAPV
jgi:ABC-type uncharacterized transport system involved in gliding motility auxiliary subunit